MNITNISDPYTHRKKWTRRKSRQQHSLYFKPRDGANEQRDQRTRLNCIAEYDSSSKILDLTTGKLITLSNSEHIVSGGGLIVHPGTVNMISNGFDPSQWANLFGGIVEPTGVTIGDLTEYTITDAGEPHNSRAFYKANVHGYPVGRQYFCLLYNFGTSNKGRITLLDDTAVLSTMIQYDTDLWETWNIVQDNAGDTRIDAIFDDIGCGVAAIAFSIEWLNSSNSLFAGISSYSTDNSNIKVYACAYAIDESVHQASHIWPVVFTDNDTYLSRAGLPEFDFEADSENYQVNEGKVDCINQVDNGNFTSWTDDVPDGWTPTSVGDETSNVVRNGDACRIISDGTYTSVVQSVFETGWYRITLEVLELTGIGLYIKDNSSTFYYEMLNVGEYTFHVNDPSVQLEIARKTGGSTDATFTNIIVQKMIPYPGLPILYNTLNGKGDGVELLDLSEMSGVITDESAPIYSVENLGQWSIDDGVITRLSNTTWEALVLLPGISENVKDVYELIYSVDYVSGYLSWYAGGTVRITGDTVQNESYKTVRFSPEVQYFALLLGTSNFTGSITIHSLQKVVKTTAIAKAIFHTNVSAENVPNNTVINVVSLNNETSDVFYLEKTVDGGAFINCKIEDDVVSTYLEWRDDTIYEAQLLCSYNNDTHEYGLQLRVRGLDNQTHAPITKWDEDSIVCKAEYVSLSSYSLLVAKASNYLVKLYSLIVDDLPVQIEWDFLDLQAFYMYYMNVAFGLYDQITKSYYVADYDGGAKAINPDTGYFIIASGNEHLVVEDQIVTYPKIINMIDNGFDPSQWNNNAAVITPTDTYVGDLRAYTVTGSGATWNRVMAYNSNYDGLPTGTDRMYCCLILDPVDNVARIYFEVIQVGTIYVSSSLLYNGSTWTIDGNDNAGNIVLEDIEYLNGLHIVKFSILWITENVERLSIGVAPGTTGTETLNLYGCPYVIDSAVSAVNHVWPVAFTGRYTYLSRSGLPYVAMKVNDEGHELIHSKVIGEGILNNTTFSGTYVSGVAPSWVQSGTLTLTEETINGEQAQGITDGNTANVLQQTLPVTENQRYRLTVSAKRMSGTGSGYVRILAPVLEVSTNILEINNDDVITYNYTFTSLSTTYSQLRVYAPSGTKIGVLSLDVVPVSSDSYEGLPDFYELLNGEPIDEASIIVNGDYSNGINNWIAGSGGIISAENNQLTVSAPDLDGFSNAYQEIQLEKGYEYEFTGGTISATNKGLVKVDRTSLSSEEIVKISTVNEGIGLFTKTFRATATETAYIQQNTEGDGSTAVFYPVTLRKITDRATITISVPFSVGIAAADIADNTNINLLSMNNSTYDLLYLRRGTDSSKRLYVKDTLISIGVDLDWLTYPVKYIAELRIGPLWDNDTETYDWKMQISVRTVNGAWSHSNVVDSAGYLPMLDEKAIRQAKSANCNVYLGSITAKSICEFQEV